MTIKSSSLSLSISTNKASVIIPISSSSGALIEVTSLKDPFPLFNKITPDPGIPYESDINLSPTNKSISPSLSTSEASIVEELKKFELDGNSNSLWVKLPLPSLKYRLSAK